MLPQVRSQSSSSSAKVAVVARRPVFPGSADIGSSFPVRLIDDGASGGADAQSPMLCDPAGGGNAVMGKAWSEAPEW